MLYSKTLPLRGVGRSSLRGTLKLISLDNGTRLEIVLPTLSYDELSVYALRSGAAFYAEHRGDYYHVGINGVSGAIIVRNGSMIAAAFSNMSASERERAFSTVRMAETRRDSARQMRAEKQSRPQVQSELPPKYKYNENEFDELKSDVARALMAKANSLFAPPDNAAEEFVPRPYVRGDAVQRQQAIEPIGKEPPSVCPPVSSRSQPTYPSAGNKPPSVCPSANASGNQSRPIPSGGNKSSSPAIGRNRCRTNGRGR